MAPEGVKVAVAENRSANNAGDRITLGVPLEGSRIPVTLVAAGKDSESQDLWTGIAAGAYAGSP